MSTIPGISSPSPYDYISFSTPEKNQIQCFETNFTFKHPMDLMNKVKVIHIKECSVIDRELQLKFIETIYNSDTMVLFEKGHYSGIVSQLRGRNTPCDNIESWNEPLEVLGLLTMKELLELRATLQANTTTEANKFHDLEKMIELKKIQTELNSATKKCDKIKSELKKCTDHLTTVSTTLEALHKLKDSISPDDAFIMVALQTCLSELELTKSQYKLQFNVSEDNVTRLTNMMQTKAMEISIELCLTRYKKVIVLSGKEYTCMIEKIPTAILLTPSFVTSV